MERIVPGVKKGNMRLTCNVCGEVMDVNEKDMKSAEGYYARAYMWVKCPNPDCTANIAVPFATIPKEILSKLS